MTSSLESAELRYIRSRAAPFQGHGAPPKIMPQSDISFHNNANCGSIDLLIRQSNSGLGSPQKNLTTPIPTPESENFSLLSLTPCRLNLMYQGQGRNEEGQGGHDSPGAESLWGRQITAEGAEKF